MISCTYCEDDVQLETAKVNEDPYGKHNEYFCDDNCIDNTMERRNEANLVQ